MIFSYHFLPISMLEEPYICRLKISRKLYRKKCETLCYVADMTKRSGYPLS